jgi:hypothetical protein
MSDLFKIFSPATTLETAIEELKAAELELLRSESCAEYAASLVTNNLALVNRLREFIDQHDDY